MRNVMKASALIHGVLMLVNAWTMWSVFAAGAPVTLVALPAVMFVFCGAMFSRALNELKEEE